MQSFVTLTRSATFQAGLRYALPFSLVTAALLMAPAVSHGAAGGSGGGGSIKSTDVMQVDEQWEVQIGTPNSSTGSPQMTFLISPTGDTSGYYAILNVNERDGAVGGMQLQLWNGNSVVSTATYNTSTLATTSEKISWTTSMSISSGTLQIDVVGLSSTTWGNTNNNTAALTVSANSTGLSNLNNYDLTGALSGNNSGVDYGGNRVSKITIKSITPYLGSKKTPGADSLGGATKQVYP